MNDKGNLQFWNVERGTEIRKVEVTSRRDVSFSQDGKYFLSRNSSNGKWTIHDWKSGEPIYEVPLHCSHMTLTANGRHLLVKRAADVTLYALPKQVFNKE